MIQFDPQTEHVNRLIDPDGPIEWISNEEVVGRQNFENKNNLIIWHIGRMMIRLSTGLNMQIDFLGRNDPGLFPKTRLLVLSNEEKKFSVVNIPDHIIEQIGEWNPPSNFPVPDPITQILSPDGGKILMRVVDPVKGPILVVYDTL